ncbi:hypothetical protein D3C76_1188190 [compost metagenome]
MSLGVANPAHQVLGPRDQLARVKRFDHIIVGTTLKADDAVDFVVAPGDQDDADLRAHPQFAGQGQAIFAGQADIEHHQVDRRVGQVRFSKLGGGCAMHVVPLLGQVGMKQFANQRIVVDDQYPRGHGMVSCYCRRHQLGASFLLESLHPVGVDHGGRVAIVEQVINSSWQPS